MIKVKDFKTLLALPNHSPEELALVEDENKVYVYKDEWVEYKPEKSESKFLEDDIVNIWGTLTGEYSYESVLGAQITIPSIKAKYMELK